MCIIVRKSALVKRKEWNKSNKYTDNGEFTYRKLADISRPQRLHTRSVDQPRTPAAQDTAAATAPPAAEMMLSRRPCAKID